MAEENKTVIEQLTELQKILTQKFALEDEIEALPKNLKEQEKKLEVVKQDYTEVLTASQKAQSDLKDLHFDYDGVVSHREASEKSMETIATQREFEALERQIKDAGAQEEELLKQIRAKEQECKELEAECNVRSEALKAQEEIVAAEQAKLNDASGSKLEEQKKLDEQCRAFVDGQLITEELYAKFCTIVRNKHGKGIVPIHGTVCQGCHIVLPIQFVNDVRKDPDKIQVCPYCSRVLYYEDVEGAENDFTDNSKPDEPEDEDTSSNELGQFADDSEFDSIV